MNNSFAYSMQKNYLGNIIAKANRKKTLVASAKASTMAECQEQVQWVLIIIIFILYVFRYSQDGYFFTLN